jgi:hypothetical protein
MRVVKLLVFLACAATLGGCGLPDQYYLQPPISGGLVGGTGITFTFSNPDHLSGDSNVAFKGYELYYKFYPDTNIEYNAYDPNNTADVVSQLTSKGFLPVASDQDQYPVRNVPAIPILPADIATNFTVNVNIRIDYPNESNFSFNAPIASPTGYFRRDIQDTSLYSLHYKPFFSNSTYPGNYSLLPLDADCTLIASGISGFPIYLAMYALSYGLQGISTPIRSIPVCMGYITLSIN